MAQAEESDCLSPPGSVSPEPVLGAGTELPFCARRRYISRECRGTAPPCLSLEDGAPERETAQRKAEPRLG